MIYWTKYKTVYNEEFGNVRTNEYETIKQSSSDFVEDGDGFEIDMNGIEYEDYLSDIAGYKIDKGKLYRVG